MYKTGDIVKSIAGHDKGQMCLVIEVIDSFVKVCNGKTKKLANPKLKKQKHIEKQNVISQVILDRIKNGTLTDKCIRYELNILSKGG